MGCAQSRIDNEESVARCKDRRNHMKDAVSARNAFSSSHTAYSVSLKNTGASLSGFSVSESFPTPSSSSGAPPDHSLTPPPPPPPPPHIDTLPPPPPLPTFSPSPLKRSSTMPPDIAASPSTTPGDRAGLGGLDRRCFGKSPVSIDEEDGDEEDREVKLQNNLRRPPPRLRKSDLVTPPPPPMPESKGLVWDYFYMVENMQGSGLGGRGEVENEDEVHDNDDDHDDDDNDVASDRRDSGDIRMRVEGNCSIEMEFKTPEKQKVVEVPDEEYLRSEVRAKEEVVVDGGTKAVTATATGQNMVKVMGAIDDHFLKASECAQDVSRMLEATRMHYHSNFADDQGHIDHAARVMRVITWNNSLKGLPNGDSGKDDFDADEYETHATILDKLLAWEKKLYEEVKRGELMKLEYQRKVALLHKQKTRSATAESLQKTKAAVSHLHTRYIVDMQSMDSTSSEINQIRDHQLYPKLLELVDGLAVMWERMRVHHENQLTVVSDLRSLDVSQTPWETTRQHHKCTAQLEEVIRKWHSEFEKLVFHQRQYVQALNSWLKLNLIPIESSLKEKNSSPPRAQSPPIQVLLVAWQEFLEKLPDEIAKTAISAFGAVIRAIRVHQEEELKLKDKYEETRKEFLRKNQAVEEWYQKYLQRRGHDEAERVEDVNPHDPVMEKRAAVEGLRKRMEEEVEAHQRLRVQVREKSLGGLKTCLPELFQAMSDYSHACADFYARLRAITQMHKSNGIPS